ncbi:hypothetical protein L6452_38649 [Arctium lappa]|uniref:Uncharacterized protein n=1 Tax=Arctium lappa TaxID=4217 RepID=A0ACB8XU87_ARCLA|nr:hypothetical protein L6452_38649 [Arctium lappa]
MINFLKGALGVPEGMFTSMPYGRIEELYKKEMANLKGDFTHRVEVERKMKERHDLNIQQPFPDSEEGTPSKDKEEVKQEETLAQKIGVIKRKKSIATKPKAKRPRTEETEKESERREDELPAEQEQNQDQPSQQTQEQTKVQFDLYMTVTDDEPMKVNPISVNAPEIIHCYHEYYLVDKIYDHSKAKLQAMLKAKLITTASEELILQSMISTARDKVNTDIELMLLLKIKMG